jgi:FlaA1/EpsC-like NDP-sugar epimerase
VGIVRPGEKLSESLISETQSQRLLRDKDGYFFIKPPYKNTVSSEEMKNYNSKLNPLDKETLRSYLEERNLLSKTQIYS